MPNNRQSEKRSPSIAFYVVLGAALYAFIQTFSLLSPIILSFLLVVLISLAVNPLISRMRRLTGGRKIPTTMVAMTLVATIVLLGWALFGPMKTSMISIAESVPEYWERLQKPLIKIEQEAVISEQKLQEEVRTEISRDDPTVAKPKDKPQAEAPVPVKTVDESNLRSGLTGMFQSALSSFTAVAFNGAQILVVLVTVFFGVIFTLINPWPIFGALFSVFPEKHHSKALLVMQRIGRFVPAWAGGTLLGMLTIGLLVFLLMWPIFGFMDALVLGLTAAIFEVIPYLGPIFSTIPAILLALGKGGMTLLWVAIAYIAVQALENNLISPAIMAKSMKVHPLAVIFSMLLCVATFGVLGVVVAAPVVAIVSIIHDELYRKEFLPTVTDQDLHDLARTALNEKPHDKD